MNPLLLASLLAGLSPAAEPPARAIDGLVPRASKAVTLDGKLDEWDNAFVAPVHIGHPDFANRGAHVLFLWDDQNLYVGLRCLDTKPGHTGPDTQVWNGDAVEFYLDCRRGDELGAPKFGEGTLHLFWTPFTGSEIKPRIQLRDLPEFKGVKLQGAEVAGEKTPWGYTAEFKLPWANVPKFTPKAGEVIGLDVELCSGDGATRTDRTFVYSGPASVGSPSAFGRVQLVDKLDPAKLEPYSRALLPVSVTQSANYSWVYAVAGVSPSIDAATVKIEAKVIDDKGKALKTTPGKREKLEGSGFPLWRGQFELFDAPAGSLTLEVRALGKDDAVLAKRSIPLVQGSPSKTQGGQQRSPMVELTREHTRLQEERPAGKRESLTVGTLFVPEGVRLQDGKLPLFVHFHGPAWLAEVAAARNKVAVVSVQLGAGSSVYARPFSDPKAFARLLEEAEQKAGMKLGPVALTAWSAGYGAVREILRVPEHYDRVDAVLLLDALHAGYAEGGAGEPKVLDHDLDVFIRFARDAAAEKKQMWVTHTEVFPGTFASTTETAQYLVDELKLKRRNVLEWGPGSTYQLTEARQGRLRVTGFVGNTAPDHVDQLHGLPEFVRWLDFVP